MHSAGVANICTASLFMESTKKSGVECHRRGKSATVPFNRLILRGILRAVRPRAADTGPPTFWRSPRMSGARIQALLQRTAGAGGRGSRPKDRQEGSFKYRRGSAPIRSRCGIACSRRGSSGRTLLDRGATVTPLAENCVGKRKSKLCRL